jgi:phthiocerol/phenolphthiocerol synthesis type-I polyketide synthase E
MALRRGEMHLPVSYQPPRTESERQLAEIWREALDIDVVGVADDYFALRGDSLVAAIIFSEIERVFGVKLPMSTLAAARTVTLLAQRIDDRRG